MKEYIIMTANDLLIIFLRTNKREISTSELYELAIKQFGVDDMYDDYEKHIRSLQQELKRKGVIVNTRHGYWALVA